MATVRGELGLHNQMAPRERRADVTQWNRELSLPETSFNDSGRGLHQDPVDLFWAQVRARPRAVALVFSDSESTKESTWTYERLESEVANIASELLTRGVRPGDRVAFCSPPSPYVLATIWAIFSIGAISVPLDPSHPRSRVSRVLDEAEPRAILGQRSALDALGLTGENVVAFDEIPANGSFEVASDRSESGYIFYTSGSTGDPKGVLCRMDQLAHYLGVARERYRFTDGDRFCSIARPTFSICMWELLSPLTAGGSLRILDRLTILDPARLCAALGDVTVAHLGPSLLKPVLGYLESEGRAMGQMRHVSSGGDIVPPDVMQRMGNRFPLAEVYVIYGCTEISCMGCTFSVPRNTSVERSFVGAPFEGVGVELVDEQGRPVAPGEVGEIRFSGPGLAECYYGRPDLTAEKFLESPDKRVYCTGDLGRLVGGQIEFLGRRDFQIQLRGIRIELGEVESALRNIPGIRDGVVAAWPAPDGEKVLVGYPVAASERFSDAELRARLADRLPEYMIPQYFVWLDALPLNHNLKIDRRALPEPSKFAEGRAPSTDAESTLFAVAKKVLGHDIDLDLGLLENGGSSLAALQLNLALRRAGAKEIPLSDLLSRTPLAELANTTTMAPSRFKLERVPFDGTARLTTSQARIWYEESAGEAGSTYAIPLLFELRADVDPSVLELALNQLVARHDGLRYSVRAVAGSPRIDIATKCELKLQVRSCDSEIELNEQVRLGTEAPFDLSRAPLLRAQLLDVKGTHRRLLLVFHHLVFDEFSIHVLLRELPALYRSATGLGDTLEPLELSYADFAQSEWVGINKDGFASVVEYFKAKFTPAPEPLEIPLDYARPPNRSGRSERAEIHLTKDFGALLQEQARKHGATPFVVLAGVFGELLRRYNSGNRVVLGTAIAGRHLPGSENSIGCFINMVPLDIPKADSPEIWPYMDRVRQECLQAIEHGVVPFDRIVREIRPRRDPSRTLLYQAALIHHKKEPLDESVLGLREIPVPPAGNLADLTLTVQESNDGIVLWLNYDAALFESSTAEALLLQVVVGLEEVASGAPHLTFLGGSAPSTPLSISKVGQSRAISPRETLQSWNATAVDYPRDVALAQLVERQVDKAPERVAIRFGDQSIGYGELEARANQWARALRRHGVGRGQLVGLCMNRSIEMVVAMLAVLKSGAAYVPLDPGFPADRLALMVEDSGLTLVLSEAGLRDSHGCDENRTLEVDTAQAELARESSERLPLDDLSAQASDTAYVLYTSGSTGRPKGVQVHHRAAVNFLTSMQRQPGLSESDRLLAVTTLSFDISVLELLLPLIVGAQIVLANRDEARDGNALCRLLEEKDVTVMQATPATWRLLLESGWQGRPGFKVLCGGEALAVDLARSLLERVGELWNMYGPTETTVWSSVWRVQNPEHGIRIGRPIANTSFWILDSSMQICPIGVVGEIYIGGDGVALGYLNRPDLTSERFVADPLNNDAGARLYKTGDLGRWRTDGELECLGRNDFQVKIRGFRIELGDIESALLKQAEVASAVVVAREDTPGDKALAAYLLQSSGQQIDIDQLRTVLGTQLPAYMVPSAFVVLDALPMTPNNKVDRKALLDLPLELRFERQPIREPANPTERHVLRLFQIALEDDSFGVEDSFFDRGGHSLLAVGLTSQLSNDFGVEFPVGLLFQAPSPAGVAKLVKRSEQLRPQPILLAGRSELPAFYFVLGVHLYRDIAAHLAAEFSVYGTYVNQEAKMIEDAGSGPSVEELAQEYVETIRRAQPHGPYRLGGASLGGVIAFEMAQQLREQGEAVEILLLLDAVAPIGLRRQITQVSRRFRGPKDIVSLARALASKVETWVEIPMKRLVPSSRGSKPEQKAGDPTIASFQRIRQQAYKQAALSYGHRIRPYSGTATLVVATQAHARSWDDPAPVWETLIADLSVLRINAGHLDILRGEEARLIAETLKR